MDGSPRRLAWFAILALALGIRLAAGVWWQQRLPAGTRFAFGDSESYWQLGRAIAQQKPYLYGVEEARIFRTPGYPALLAPLFLLWGNDPPVFAARALSAALNVAAIAVVMQLACSLFDERVAFVAGLALAIDPGTITLGVFVLSEAPFCPFELLHLAGWIAAWRSLESKSTTLYSAGGGVAAGLATLMRPSWLLFLPLAAMVGLIFHAERKKQFVIIAWMCLGLSATMSPWWVRNYSITGRFIPTTLQIGASLYDGLGPHADGSSNMEFVAGFIAAQRASDANQPRPFSDAFEERLDRRMREASLTWAKSHPRAALQLAVTKFLRMWSPWPNASELGSTLTKFALAMGYLPMIVLGLVGAWRWRGDWSLMLLTLPACYFTLMHVIFVSSLRYRQPAMMSLAILAAAVAVQLYDRWRGAVAPPPFASQP